MIASPEHESGDGASGFGQQRGGDGDAGAQDGEAAARRSESNDDEHQHETAAEVGAGTCGSAAAQLPPPALGDGTAAEVGV